MKKFKGMIMLCMALLLIISTTACASNSKNDGPIYKEAKSDMSYDSATGSSNGMDKGEATAPQETADISGGKSNAITIASTVTSNIPSTGMMEKIIRRIEMELETQEFDTLINGINDEIRRLEGYVENSSISGKRIQYENRLRRGNIVARIPKDKLDEFIGVISEASNVVNKAEWAENVTLQYVDTESHIKALEIEQEKLYELLGKTGTLEDILTLESRLSSIRYELESYKSQLRIYDNKVDYSTVTLNIQEVERFTPKEEAKVSVMTRIKNGFSDTIYNISEGFKDFIVGFTVNLPYILFWAALLLIGSLLIRRSYKKYIGRKLKGKNSESTDKIQEKHEHGENNKSN